MTSESQRLHNFFPTETKYQLWGRRDLWGWPSVAGDAGDDISSKNHEKFMLFLPVCHCGTLYSKSVIPCARPSTALWHTFGRCTAEALSLRVFGARSSSSRGWMPSMSTNILCNLSHAPATSSEQSPAPPGMIWVRFVTHSWFYDMPSWTRSYAYFKKTKDWLSAPEIN